MPKNNWYTKIQKMNQGIVADALESVKTRLLPLPSPSLNWALGGGLAFGKIATIFGPEQSGKSLVAQLAIAELHKTDPEAWAIWYDAEFSFDKDYAAKLGVDLKRLWLIQTNKPTNIFDHFADTVWSMIQDGFPCKIMVIDSIKSIMAPKEASLDSIESFVIGDLSSLLNKAFRKIIEPIRKGKVLTICVQQVNEEMDPMKIRRGIKWHVPSGQALKHFSDYMILVEKVEAKSSKLFDPTHKNIQNLPIQVGHTVRCKIEKSRVDCPHLVAEFRLRYGVGVVDTELEIAKLAVELGLVSRPNAIMYEFQNYKVKGFKKFVELVQNTPELYRELIKAINNYDVFQLSIKKNEIGISTNIDNDSE